MRGGSWPPLLAAAVVFLLLFALQRCRSAFLAIEADRAPAAALAAEHGLGVADVFALRDLVGVDAPLERWREAVATFARDRARLGEPLAAVAAAGGREAAERARAGAGDAVLAWQRFRLEPAALPGLRFLAVRDRFAARDAGRDQRH